MSLQFLLRWLLGHTWSLRLSQASRFSDHSVLSNNFLDVPSEFGTTARGEISFWRVLDTRSCTLGDKSPHAQWCSANASWPTLASGPFSPFQSLQLWKPHGRIYAKEIQHDRALRIATSSCFSSLAVCRLVLRVLQHWKNAMIRYLVGHLLICPSWCVGFWRCIVSLWYRRICRIPSIKHVCYDWTQSTSRSVHPL